MSVARIYCIAATDAPIVAVFLRGPTDWSHVGLWKLDDGSYDAGAWFHGRLFPRRSDVSPDGRLLCCFAHKPAATWNRGEAWVAISKLPWLTALYAFGTCGTHTRGYHFTHERDADDETSVLPISWGLRATPAIQFATERRRGWQESPDSPPRQPDDAWDAYRNARLRKPQPGGNRMLCVQSVGLAGGEFGIDFAVDGLRVRYWLERDGVVESLTDVQWADWDARGRLLTATREARLKILDVSGDTPRIEGEIDLSELAPDPQPSPDWAQHW